MKRKVSVFLVLLVSCFYATTSFASELKRESNMPIPNHLSQEQLSNQFLSLKIMLVKLRKLMFSLKDIDELEAIGLSHDDVDIMRSTLLAKINQTKLHALVLIRRL